MGGPRKKSSSRQTTRRAAKVNHLSIEARKKAKKAAKKDVTWKSNKPKGDIGVPNSFPFKDEILAEAAAEKIRREEEKVAKREASRALNGSGATLASTAALAAALAADSQRMEDEAAEGSAFDDEENLVSDPSLRLHARSLRKVLEASDVLIEVLDARDPVGTRCRAVERELKSLDGGRKKLVLVLNKIDLVPPPVVQAWLAHLRLQAPTLAFKSSTQQQRSHLSASSLHTPTSASGSSTKPLMELIKGFRINPNVGGTGAGDQKIKQSLTIGLIGHPNVGKSSLINTLKRSKACAVAPTPGWTKEVQEVTLEKGVRVLDCPGVVVEARGEVEGALRGMVKPEDVRDCRAPVELILQRCKKEHLMMLYNIPAFNGVTEFLVEVARCKGRLKKGGIPDLDGTAVSILRDWVSGRIPYYTSPPAPAPVGTQASTSTTTLETVTDEDVNSAKLLTTFAPAFDLAALFGEADALAFGDLDDDAPKGVKMDGFAEDSAETSVGWATGEIEEEDMEDLEDDAELIDVEDLLEDDEEEEDDEEMEEDLIPALLAAAEAEKAARSSKGRAAKTNIVSVAPSNKKNKAVSFASKHLGPTSQSNKLFGANDAEAPVSLNKDIKKNAKKNAKKARKEGGRMEVEESEGSAPAPARAASTAGGAYSFEEFYPTAGGKGKKATGSAMDLDE